MVVSRQSESDMAENQEAGVSAGEATRYHYLDNLRALAMLAGVILHASLSYSLLFKEGWPMADSQSSRYVDYIVWLVHTFRMPLFFVISGYFAHLLLEKRGTKAFLKHRALRITLPFIIFWPVMAAAILGVFYFAIVKLNVDTPPLNMIKLAFENPEALGGQQPPPPSTTHLWFIYHLTIFCFFSVVVARFIKINDRFRKSISSPGFLLIGLPAMAIVPILSKYIPLPAPESFIPSFWGMSYFGLFFFVGWVFYRDKLLLDKLEKWSIPMVVSSSIGFIIMCLIMPTTVPFEELLKSINQPPELNLRQVIAALSNTVLACHLTFLCLIYSRKFLNFKNNKMRYISDASYWIYIMHLPLVFLLQALFRDVHLPIIVEITAMSTIIFIVGLISYATLVRYTPIGWMLNGKRVRSKRPVVSSSGTSS